MQLWLLIGLALLPALELAAADGEIYQWRDSAGVMHFTDDPMRVPEAYREKGRRKLQPLNAYEASDLAGKTVFDGFSDRELWQARCAECHAPGSDQDGRIGLGGYVHARNRGPVRELEDIIPGLNAAMSAEHMQMESLQDITDEEMKQIARYFLSESR